MFAYCGNNPIIYVDDCGSMYSIGEYNKFHRSVQKDINDTYGLATEVYIKNGTKRGLLDLYDPSTGSYYEIKYYALELSWHGSKQRNKYIGATISSEWFKDYSLGTAVPGKEKFSGTVECGDKTIIYYSSNNPRTPELILYRVVNDQSSKSLSISNEAAALGAFTALGALGTIGMAGGMSSPTPGSVHPIMNVNR